MAGIIGIPGRLQSVQAAAFARNPRPTSSECVNAILDALDMLPWEAPADAVYSQVRGQLERIGRAIGGNDLLIAAHALALGHTLVTDNEREFSRVEKLRVENWLR